MRRLGSIIGIGVAAIAVLAAACAPAAAPKPPEQSQPQPAQQSTQFLAPAPKEQPVQPQVQQTKEQKPAGGPVSTNGIPLDPTAKLGGTLKIPLGAEPPSFSPWEEAVTTAFAHIQPVTNMIVQLRSWGTMDDYVKAAYYRIEPDLARSWEQSPDGLQWTFRFFDGVKWADGTPFTCKDAKWTLDSIRTGKGLRRSPRAVHFLPVKEVTCADDLTMVIKLSRPKAALLEMVAMPYNVVLPKHAYENDTAAMREKPLKAGTGPFILKDYIPGEKRTFVRNPDYWNKPFPYLDGLETPVLNQQAANAGFRAGRLDFFGSGYAGSGPTQDQFRKECKDCQFFPPLLTLGQNVIYVNHQRPPWNIPEVKDALSYAIDRQRIADLRPGWDRPPYGGGVTYEGTYWTLPPERVKALPGFDFADPAGNKQKAREALARAGYRPGDLKVKLRWWVSSTAAIPPVTIKEDWDAIGIQTELEPIETARAYDVLSSADFDLQQHGHYLAGPDPDIMLYEHYYTGSDRNYGRYSNPRVDALIDQESQTVDPEARRRIVWDISETLMREEAKIIYSLGGLAQPTFGPRVQGLMPGNLAIVGYGPWQRYEHVWLKQ